MAELGQFSGQWWATSARFYTNDTGWIVGKKPSNSLRFSFFFKVFPSANKVNRWKIFFAISKPITLLFMSDSSLRWFKISRCFYSTKVSEESISSTFSLWRRSSRTCVDIYDHTVGCTRIFILIFQTNDSPLLLLLCFSVAASFRAVHRVLVYFPFQHRFSHVCLTSLFFQPLTGLDGQCHGKRRINKYDIKTSVSPDR